MCGNFHLHPSDSIGRDLDQHSPRSLDMWIELDCIYLTQVISTNKHLFKWALFQELPSFFDIFFYTPQTTNATGSHWTHHSTFAHTLNIRVPSVFSRCHPHQIHTYRSGHEHKEHTPFKSDNISNTNIQHNIPRHFDISAIVQHTFIVRKKLAKG